MLLGLSDCFPHSLGLVSKCELGECSSFVEASPCSPIFRVRGNADATRVNEGNEWALPE